MRFSSIKETVSLIFVGESAGRPAAFKGLLYRAIDLERPQLAILVARLL